MITPITHKSTAVDFIIDSTVITPVWLKKADGREPAVSDNCENSKLSLFFMEFRKAK